MMKVGRLIAVASFAWLAAGVLAAQSVPLKSTPTLEEQLRDVRFELHIDGGKFSGSGVAGGDHETLNPIVRSAKGWKLLDGDCVSSGR